MLGLLKKLFGGTPVDYKGLMAQGAIIIDVRSQAEYKSGHINGSRNYPLDSLRGKINDLKKQNKPVITVCLSGGRSSVAKNLLKAAGIEAYNGGPWTSLRNKL